MFFVFQVISCSFPWCFPHGLPKGFWPPGDPREGHGGARAAPGHGRAEADLGHSRRGEVGEVEVASVILDTGWWFGTSILFSH